MYYFNKYNMVYDVANPWLNLLKGNGIIAECDRAFFEQKRITPVQYANSINIKDDKVELTFDCLPEPYSGNPNSKVYCLNKNPGKPDSCFFNDKNFHDATLKNLRLEQDTCFWAETIKNKCGKLHDGVNWLQKRTKELSMILDEHPDIFFIEFFPYHSSKGFRFPDHLPSYSFSDALIKQAMMEKKIIIIMREKDRWLKRINGLKEYENLFILWCPQGGYLTSNNIVRYSSDITLTEKEITKYFQIK